MRRGMRSGKLSPSGLTPSPVRAFSATNTTDYPRLMEVELDEYLRGQRLWILHLLGIFQLAQDVVMIVH